MNHLTRPIPHGSTPGCYEQSRRNGTSGGDTLGEFRATKNGAEMFEAADSEGKNTQFVNLLQIKVCLFVILLI